MQCYTYTNSRVAYFNFSALPGESSLNMSSKRNSNETNAGILYIYVGRINVYWKITNITQQPMQSA